MNRYFRTNEIKDMKDNFDEFIHSTKDFIKGNEKESKWLTIYLYMFLQSLMINILGQMNDFEIIGRKANIKIAEEKWNMEVVSNLKGKYIVLEKAKMINISLAFCSDNDFEELENDIKQYNKNVTKKQLIAGWKKATKLKPTGELYKTLNKKMDKAIDS